MYFYIIKGPFRVGFGITGDYVRRAKDYTGMWGGEAEFSYLFEGNRSQITNLERLIKTQYQEMCWKLDDWNTEWLDNGWEVDQMLEFVESLIAERHMPISRVK